MATAGWDAHAHTNDEILSATESRNQRSREMFVLIVVVVLVVVVVLLVVLE
jgi:t-SNARE complex subunit (syntaxin)